MLQVASWLLYGDREEEMMHRRFGGLASPSGRWSTLIPLLSHRATTSQHQRRFRPRWPSLNEQSRTIRPRIYRQSVVTMGMDVRNSSIS